MAAAAGLALYFGAGGSAARQKAGAAVTVPTVVVRWGNSDQTVAVAGQTTSPRFASVVIPVQRGRARWQLHLTKLAPGGSMVRAGDVVAEVDALSLKEQLSDLEKYTFRAPMDGMVVMGTLNRPGSSDSAQYKVGDQVRPGQVPMKIMQTARFRSRSRR